MKTFIETYNEVKDKLSEMVTAENTDTITNLVKGLDEIKDLYEGQEKEVKGLKDKMVDIVRNTTFAKPSQESLEQQEKSLDDIMSDKLGEILAKRK